MSEQERERIEAEFHRVKEECERAPIPAGADVPDWARADGVESLPEFFDGAAHLWDAKFGADYAPEHAAVAAQVAATDAPVRILDVGCGTGLVFEYIFRRAPNARITGLDQAPRMLDEVRRKYADRMGQIELIEASCLEWPDGLADFDCAMSTLTVHHFPPEIKTGIYRDIRSALKEGGVYIEGDQAARADENAAEGLRLYEEWIAKLPGGDRGVWNYDITLTPATNMRLMAEAGFADCEVRYEQYDDNGIGHAVIAARR